MKKEKKDNRIECYYCKKKFRPRSIVQIKGIFACRECHRMQSPAYVPKYN